MSIYDILKDHPRYDDHGGLLKAYKRHNGDVGLEIETEAKQVYNIPQLKFWTAHNDPSLRGAFNQEFVLKQPLKFEKELDLALDEFRDFSKDIKFIKNSITTSVHVHLNFLNCGFRTLGNFIVTYILTENLLSNFAGDGRKSNLFCLPVRDAEETYKNCVTFFRNAESRMYNNIFFSENATKYAAMNLSAFRNFGSIEIRSFRGETDVKIIREWLNILEQLYLFSHQDISPKDILINWKNKGVDILNDIYGNHSKLLIYPGYEQDIESNLWYAASIAYSVKDWIDLDKVIVENNQKFTAKQLQNAARQLFGLDLNELDPAQIDHVVANLKRQNVGAMNNPRKLKPVRLNEIRPIQNADIGLVFNELEDQALEDRDR